MMATGHFPSGAAAWLPIGSALGLSVPANLALAAAAAVAALLPDLDHEDAFLARAIPGGRWLARAIGGMAGGHRCGTHYLVAAIPVAWFAWFTVLTLSKLTPWPADSRQAAVVAAAVGVGYVAHILGDWLTLGKFPILGPFSRRRSALRLFRTGGWIETLLVAPALGVAVVWQVWVLLDPTVMPYVEVIRSALAPN